jgi:hypothetical protein
MSSGRPSNGGKVHQRRTAVHSVRGEFLDVLTFLRGQLSAQFRRDCLGDFALGANDVRQIAIIALDHRVSSVRASINLFLRTVPSTAFATESASAIERGSRLLAGTIRHY